MGKNPFFQMDCIFHLYSLLRHQEVNPHPLYNKGLIPFSCLDEEREKDKVKFTAHQQVVKIWFDKHKAKEKKF
jgi:hypothetical protein